MRADGPLEIEVSQPPSSTVVTNRAAPLEVDHENAVVSEAAPEVEAQVSNRTAEGPYSPDNQI